MQAGNLQFPARTETPDPRPAVLAALAERLSRAIAVARALHLAGRVVDLAGIEDGVGLLCARTLDLPPELARAMLPTLHDMLAQVESMDFALRRPNPPCPDSLRPNSLRPNSLHPNSLRPNSLRHDS